MKHPVRSDFDIAVTEAGVNVTFKPTNSIYSFYRLADSEDVTRLGPVSPGPVRHAGPSEDTKDYSPDEVQEKAQRIAAEAAASVWSLQDEEGADKLTFARSLNRRRRRCDRMNATTEVIGRMGRICDCRLETLKSLKFSRVYRIKGLAASRIVTIGPRPF